MLKYKLINPDIISVLATAGHGAKVLIADSNYPTNTKVNEKARLVFLNITPGIPSATDIMEVLLDAIEIESAYMMRSEDGNDQEIFKEYSVLLPKNIKIEKLARGKFYDAVSSSDTCLVIQTGEQRLSANLLLTIGAISPK